MAVNVLFLVVATALAVTYLLQGSPKLEPAQLDRAFADAVAVRYTVGERLMLVRSADEVFEILPDGCATPTTVKMPVSEFQNPRARVDQGIENELLGVGADGARLSLKAAFTSGDRVARIDELVERVPVRIHRWDFVYGKTPELRRCTKQQVEDARTQGGKDDRPVLGMP